MSTLKQIVYNIADGLEREKDPQFIARVQFNVLYYRSMFIRRDLQKNGFFAPHFVQRIGGLQTKEIDQSEVYQLDLGKSVMRSIEPIPTVIRLNTRSAFYYVGTVDKMTSYSYISPREIPYMKYSSFSKKMPRYTYLNGYLYFINVNPDKVTVEAAFQDPTQLASYLNEFGELAYTDESEFPLADDMIDGITVGLLSGTLKLIGDGEANDVNINE